MLTTKKRHNGYFLMDSGLKIPFEKGEIVWLGEDNNLKILADRIVGWDIDEDEA